MDLCNCGGSLDFSPDGQCCLACAETSGEGEVSMTQGHLNTLIKARIFQSVLLRQRSIDIEIKRVGDNLYEVSALVVEGLETKVTVPVEHIFEVMISLARGYMVQSFFIEEQIDALTRMI